MITAPCFPERVLHHAIMNVCEPVFERWLIADTFACRQGKGRIAALHACPAVRRPVRLLPQARHPQVFRQRLARDPAWHGWRGCSRTARLLELFGRIIAAFRTAPGRGLADRQPDLAALRQLLPGLARPVRQGGPRASRGYVRYMDDWRCGPISSAELAEHLAACRSFLAGRLDA